MAYATEGAYKGTRRPRVPLPELKVAVEMECNHLLSYCGLVYYNKQTITRGDKARCITSRIEEILEKFHPDQEKDVRKIIDAYNFYIPHLSLEGGKRKRRTMHRKRSHKKNSSRRNRRVR